MPYTINRTNGLKITVVADGTINTTSLDLTLVGKNYTGYGEAFNENFVKLLENFSNNKQPLKPLSGQLWYDSSSKRISVYNGTKFRPIGIVVSSDSRPSPSDSNKGDLWFDQSVVGGALYAYNGVSWTKIGPVNSKVGNTGAIASTVLNSDNTLDTPVIKETINSTIAFISYAGPRFNVDYTDDVYTESNISLIQPGITMPGADATHGVSVTNVLTKSGHLLWGTAASAIGLVQSTNATTPGYHSADEFLLTSELAALQDKVTINDNDGILIGNPTVFQLHVTQANGNRIANASVVNGKIFNVNVNTTAGGTYTNVVSFDGTDGLKVLPNTSTAVTIGSTSTPFESVHTRNIYAERITATDFIYDSEEFTAGTLTVSGTATAVTFYGSGAGLTNIPNGALVNSSVTVAAGTGLSGGGNVALGGTITLTNAGTLSVAGTANQVLVNGLTTAATGAVTLSLPQSIATSSSPTFAGLSITNGITASSLTASSLTAGVGGGTVNGNWILGSGATLQATYADLAERYASDADYAPGTVLVLGGSAEVTTTTLHGDIARAGIVSTNPAYTLNETSGDNVTHPYIALKGRVPCKVVGPVSKGDILVTSEIAGHAESAYDNDNPLAALGRALEDFTGDSGVIEVMVI